MSCWRNPVYLANGCWNKQHFIYIYIYICVCVCVCVCVCWRTSLHLYVQLDGFVFLLTIVVFNCGSLTHLSSLICAFFILGMDVVQLWCLLLLLWSVFLGEMKISRINKLWAQTNACELYDISDLTFFNILWNYGIWRLQNWNGEMVKLNGSN